MNSLIYYQPEDEQLIEQDYHSYSVWLNRDFCQEQFPASEIKILRNENIEIPSFEDAIQIIVPTLTLTQVLAEHSIMGYDYNDFDENHNLEIHIIAVHTPLTFKDMYSEFINHMEINRCDYTDEDIGYLEVLRKTISEYDEGTLFTLEFLD